MNLLRSLTKIEKSAEARAKANQRRRDIRAEKNAGIWEDVRSKYLDANGNPRTDIIIPTWFLNIYKTWNGGEPTEENWNKWCEKQIDHTGIDPRSREVGRPKLPQHMKSNPTKVKRSDQMMELLHTHGIEMLFNPFDRYEYPKLKDYPGWEMVPNGRVRNGDSTISVYKFLQNFATV